MTKLVSLLKFDYFLLAALPLLLVLHWFNVIEPSWQLPLLAFFASIATLPVFVSAFKSLREKKISVDLLASIALLVSIIHQEWESAVFINLMLTSARLFGEYTSNRSKNAIKSLLKLRPEKVRVKRGKRILEETIANIQKGDLIVIDLGERVAVDGIVIRGEALVDQSSLTGESLPLTKKVGDEVLSSTLCVSGSLTIRAEKVGSDTTFEKIVKLVEESQQNKVGIQTMADRFTGYYISITVIGSLIVYLLSRDLSLVLSVLLVTCADDIAVAVPMAFSAAIGNAASRGIVVKGASYLDGLTKVKTLIMDKTGTLTSGKIKVETIVPFAKFSKEEVIRLAATADFFSDHPVAKAIVSYAKENNIKLEEPIDFKETSGNGIMAKYKGKKIFCGRPLFLEKNGIKISTIEKRKIEALKKHGSMVLTVGYGTKFIGALTLADEVRPEAKGAIVRLKRMGVKKFVMLTGDNESVAAKVAVELGIDNFHANLLPEDKINYIKKYLNKKTKIAMIGDGVNDAAALALADVGISMGAIGSDVAIEASDVALMKDDFSKVAEVMALSKRTMRVARQNFLIWGIVNVIGLTLAFSRLIDPQQAAAFNFATDFLPIFNSLRLFRKTKLN